MSELRDAIIAQLQTVVDPETGADVWRMRLIEGLTVDPAGVVSYRFRPSSPLCPIAVPLAQAIKRALASVPGVAGQRITVIDYVQAELLTKLINQD